MLRSLPIFFVMLSLVRSFTISSRTTARRVSKSFSLGITPPTATYLDSERLALSVTASSELSFTGDLLVIPFYKPKVDKSDSKDDIVLLAELKKSIPSGLAPNVQTLVADLLDEGIFKGDVLSKQVVRLSGSAVKYVALVGLGANPKKGEATDLEISSASRLGKTVALIAKDVKAGKQCTNFVMGDSPFANFNVNYVCQLIVTDHNFAFCKSNEIILWCTREILIFNITGFRRYGNFDLFLIVSSSPFLLASL